MKKILYLATSLLLLASCSKENPTADTRADDQHNIMVTLKTPSILAVGDDSDENKIELLNVFSFFKLPGQDHYKFETRFIQPITPSDLGQIEVNLNLRGSFPRILYFYTNHVEGVSYAPGIVPGLTATDFESYNYLSDKLLIPASPFCMSAKVECPDASAITTLPVELALKIARIDIDNRYPAFAIDSIVLNDAPSGTYIHNGNAPKATRSSVSYGNASKIYMYQTPKALLNIYGKYNGIRTVLDINLKDITSGTKYTLTLRSADNMFVSSKDLVWDVKEWSKGDIIDTTPDQK